MSDEATAAARPEPPVIPKDPDPTKPLFFVSHATAYGDSRDVPVAEPNSPFSVFFRDLSQDVGQLVARRAGADPGFIDRGMHAGVDWEHEILTAVGTCQVLIALVSSPFKKSEWCGREWHAFDRRRVWRRSDKTLATEPPCILPVIWAPHADESTPGKIRGRQLFVPGQISDIHIGPVYQREGLYGLYMTGLTTGQTSAYRATVWRLALEIQRLVRAYWVEPDIPPNVKSLTNVFAEGET
jgi:hypothetical protein